MLVIWNIYPCNTSHATTLSFKKGIKNYHLRERLTSPSISPGVACGVHHYYKSRAQPLYAVLFYNYDKLFLLMLELSFLSPQH
ncbi:hypothetical protein NTGM5_680020 [Candidatus Nitrotoga sp. M5]|nr:hypothetical protein NTGM5_680020 [Candidatus Nitrotoga sp. M5]